jgi:uncharacterized protein YecE (DUF72 family)
VDIFADEFLGLLEPYRQKIGPVIFEFGTFAQSDFRSVEDFADHLNGFLAALPEGYRYAVEVRNRDFLDRPYLDALRANNAAHVLSAWTRMPSLGTQMDHEQNFTADFIVCRALLTAGRAYEQAVEQFAPYTHVIEPNPETRHALAALVTRAKDERRQAYVYINNRLEGNAPGTIRAVLEIQESVG